MDTSSRIVIVGAGCYGMSSAYHLLKRGFINVTIVDRSETLPAPDAASTDLNKIVRTSYDDKFYTLFAQEAIAAWKSEPWIEGVYHESGVLVLGAQESSYQGQAYQHDLDIGANLRSYDTASDIQSAIPDSVPKKSTFEGVSGYLNLDGGWAESAVGVERLMAEVQGLGGTIVAGFPVENLIRRDGKTGGVQSKDGRVEEADHVILAAGSWTATTFAKDLDTLNLETRCLATGQTVATIQLTPEEVEQYAQVPVVINFSTGFYVFPPNKDGIVKIAIHSGGYAQTDYTMGKPISVPRTISSHGADGLRIPRDSVRALREGLRTIYPALAEKKFLGTRLCWYTDSPDSDWIIGPHPTDPGLSFATAGSGHGYKFLPVLGRLVADSLQGKLSPDLAAKFAVNRRFESGDGSRPLSKVEELAEVDLCTPTDLLP